MKTLKKFALWLARTLLALLALFTTCVGLAIMVGTLMFASMDPDPRKLLALGGSFGGTISLTGCIALYAIAWKKIIPDEP